MKFFRFIFQLPNIKLWYFYFLLTANIVLYYEIRIERDRTIMVGYKYDRNELMKARVKNYYLQANYRALVKNYSNCKQGK